MIPTLKNIGQSIKLRLDPEVCAFVTMYHNKICLKMATPTGWFYFDPMNWDDVEIIKD